MFEVVSSSGREKEQTLLDVTVLVMGAIPASTGSVYACLCSAGATRADLRPLTKSKDWARPSMIYHSEISANVKRSKLNI